MHTFFIYKTFFLYYWHRRLYSELYNQCQLSPLKYENIKFSEFLEIDFKFLWPQFKRTKLNKKCIFQNYIRPPHKKDPQNSCVFSLISAQFFFRFIFLCNSNLLIWWFIFCFGHIFYIYPLFMDFPYASYIFYDLFYFSAKGK